MAAAGFDDRIAEDRRAVNDRLAALLPAADEEPASLHGAMRYATIDGGKRLRAILCLAGHRLCGDPRRGAALDAGCAIECLHAYTLIHDDLPALDNDDLRRGRPSCHRACGEAVAILAGDALLTFAFEVLARCDAPADRVLDAVGILSRAAGSRYLVGGQVADLEGEGCEPTEARVGFIHSRKTAELIAASLSIGACLAGADRGTIGRIHEIGRSVGFAFQIADDILDVEGSAEKAGKALRKDEKRKKITYPARFGMEASRETARRLVADGARAMETLGDNGYVSHIFSLIVNRSS
jgi:geranylgeranyl diphosphate synthase type II